MANDDQMTPTSSRKIAEKGLQFSMSNTVGRHRTDDVQRRISISSLAKSNLKARVPTERAVLLLSVIRLQLTYLRNIRPISVPFIFL